MLLKDISPFVRHVRHFTISDSTPSSGKDVKTRDNRLFFVTDGQADITIEGKEYQLKRDTLLVIRSGKSYRIIPRKKVSVIVVNFDFTEDFSSITQSFHPFSADFPGVLEDITFDDATDLNDHLITHDGARYESRVRSLLTEFFGKDEWKSAFLGATVKAIILDLARLSALTAKKNCSTSHLVSEVISYLKEHYGERVENETLSEHFHFTSIYINRVFKRETGTSVRQYLIALRIDIAKELLSSGEYTPSATANLTGFDDYPHFSKTFKKFTGKSPKEYLKG